MIKGCLLLVVAVCASAAPRYQPWTIAFNNGGWTRQDVGMHPIDISSLARAMATEWAKAFPTNAIIDGQEKSASDVILGYIDRLAAAFPSDVTDSPQSEGQINRVNNLAVRMVDQWRKEFPVDVPTLRQSISTSALDAIVDSAIEMLGQWRASFPIEGTPSYLMNTAVLFAPGQISDEEVLNINTQAIKMAKQWSKAMPSTIEDHTFPQLYAPTSVSKDELAGINSEAIAAVQQWRSAFPLENMRSIPMSAPFNPRSGLTNAELDTINSKAISMIQGWGNAFPAGAMFPFPAFRSSSPPTISDVRSVNTGAIDITKDWIQAFPIGSIQPYQPTSHAAAFAAADQINADAQDVLRQFQQSPAAVPTTYSVSGPLGSDSVVSEVKNTNKAVIASVKAKTEAAKKY